MEGSFFNLRIGTFQITSVAAYEKSKSSNDVNIPIHFSKTQLIAIRKALLSSHVDGCDTHILDKRQFDDSNEFCAFQSEDIKVNQPVAQFRATSINHKNSPTSLIPLSDV